MKLKIVNSGTEHFPYYQLMDGEAEFCATDNIENAENIVKLFDLPVVSKRCSHCLTLITK